MRKFFTVLCFLIIITGTNFAQKKIGFEFDYARFKLDDKSVYLELYYDIKEGDFTQVKVDNGIAIKGKLSIEITNTATKQQAYAKDFPFEDKFVQGSEEIKTKNMLGVLGISIPKGEYTLKVVIDDLNDKTKSKSITDNLIITPFDDQTSAVSDIQLASNIFKEGADKNSIFYKSTLEVLPNPAILYSNLMPVLHYYIELYNYAGANKTYKLVKTLFNMAGKKITSSSKLLTQKASSFVEIGNINLSSYPTDNYNLEIAVVDTLTKEAKLTTKRFYYYNANVKKQEVVTGNAEFIGSEYAVMGEKECNTMIDQIKYISTTNELEQIAKLDVLEGKRRFIYNFWMNRNEGNGLGVNESKVEFDKRLEYANKYFGTKYKEAYKTDRGRVVIKYGIPDDIERHPSAGNSQPFEIWTFNNVEGEPNVIFCFGDLSNFGNYLLLHSTKRGEAYDLTWKNQLVKQSN